MAPNSRRPVSLIDVNVLAASLVPEHEDHVCAVEWFATDAVGIGWATCVVTELGVIRVIRVCAQLPGGAWPPNTTASALLVVTASNPGYAWWPVAVSPVVLQEVRSANTANR